MTVTNQTIMDMYLACYSQEEIAAAVDMPRKTVGDRIANFSDLGNLAKSAKTHANHEEQEFQVPLYNVWTKSKISTELKHFGNGCNVAPIKDRSSLTTEFYLSRSHDVTTIIGVVRLHLFPQLLNICGRLRFLFLKLFRMT